MIADPTAIPETEADAAEYLEAMEQAFLSGDNAGAAVLARSLADAQEASEAQRGRAYAILGTCHEQDGAIDDAIDAYRRAGLHGNESGTADANRLLAGEHTGLIEGGRPPANEAEADKYWEAAKAAHNAGDDERAYQLAWQLHESDVCDATQRSQAAYLVGLGLKGMGDHDAAYHYFREASEGDGQMRELALTRLDEYHDQDGNADAGLDHSPSEPLTDAEAVSTMLQAAIDRYDSGDTAGAEARFTAVHDASPTTAEQKGYAAYYLAVLAWHAGNYDVARVHYREAKASADADTAALAGDMLRQHWNE